MNASENPFVNPPLASEALSDRKTSFPVLESREVFRGRVFSMLSQQVRYEHEVVCRDFIKHPGAVAIVALRRGQDASNPAGKPEVLMIDQYRHPVGATLWEIPAGLLDVAGEDSLAAAQRELREEASLQATRWDVLIDYFTSPGGSSESLRVFLAQDLTFIPPENNDFVKEGEEAFMTSRWVTLDDALNAIFDGRLHNPSAVVGVLATALFFGLPGPSELRSPSSVQFR